MKSQGVGIGREQLGHAFVRVRPAEDEQLRNSRHLPGGEIWLVGERRPSGERKYYLANLPPRAALEELAALIKARWACEQTARRSWRSSSPGSRP